MAVVGRLNASNTSSPILEATNLETIIKVKATALKTRTENLFLLKKSVKNLHCDWVTSAQLEHTFCSSGLGWLWVKAIV